MNFDTKTIKSNMKKYSIFFLVIFCFVAVPAFILSYSVYRYFQSNEELIVNDLKSYTQHMANELRRNISAEKYFCRVFHEYNLSELSKPDSNIEDCINFCKDFKDKYKNDIDFVVLTNESNIKFNSNPNTYKHSEKIWSDAFHFIKYNYALSPDLLGKGEKGDLEALKEIFGFQTINNTLNTLYTETIYSLIWGDYSGKIPPGGVYSFKWGALFVFISKNLLFDIVHLKYNILDFSTNINITTGLYNTRNINDSIWTNKPLDNISEIKNILNNPNTKDKRFIETNWFYIYKQNLANSNVIFSFVLKKNSDFSLLLKAIFLFIIYFILSFHIIKYFRNVIILEIPGEVSIRFKIVFLFSFATLIPLLLFAVVSHEYEIYKRQALIKEAKVLSVENILSVEQRYQSFLKNMSNSLDKSISKWVKTIKDKDITKSYIKILDEDFDKYPFFDIYILPIDLPYIWALEGLFKYYGSLDSLQFDYSNSLFNQNQKKVESDKLRDYVENFKTKYYKMMIIIVKKIYSFLSGQELPGGASAKIELIAESFLQKPLSEIIYGLVEIISEGVIKEWGTDNNVYLGFIKFVYLSDKPLPDYVVITSFLPKEVQNKFVEDISIKTNRNNLGLKFIAYEKYERFFVPEIYNGNKDIVDFAKRAVEKPTDELVTINLNDEDYIAVGVSGKKLSNYTFIGLYPIRNIDVEISKQMSLLWILGVFTMILSVGLAQMISKSFINPLLKLQNGALAIENRNFKHRLSDLATDEFGEVGNIFNQAIVGLQELEIAKVVQESLFPKPDFSQGKFTIYGKSVTMIDVGGDYLDFFKIDDNSFAVLLGDVAGHGVGAAVIMAMAKAAILNAGELLHSPAAVLNQIHKIILAAKNSKQRKIMTFQYLYVNSETGENLYANAGACNPLLIRHFSNSAEEIKMSAPVLGAFKKAVYKEMPLDFQPGDALIFYTDGIVECKNKNGEMLGYDGLKTLLMNNWDSNPERYYNNIFRAYLDYVGQDTDASDDLTFVILMYNG